MLSRKSLSVSLGIGVAVALVAASPAVACSQSVPPSIDELASGSFEGTPVAGVYEQHHIDSAPHLGVRAERTVSVVTRYWGTPPANTGRVIHGNDTVLAMSSCGNESGHEGMVGYGWVAEGSTSEYRGLPWVNLGGPDTWQTAGTLTVEQEQMLEAAFGPPVILEVSAATRAGALVQLWWAPVLVVGTLGAIAAVISMILRRRWS